MSYVPRTPCVPPGITKLRITTAERRAHFSAARMDSSLPATSSPFLAVVRGEEGPLGPRSQPCWASLRGPNRPRPQQGRGRDQSRLR